MVRQIQKLIREKAWYFTALAMLLIIGGMLVLANEKGAAILFFNDHRSAGGDIFFRWVTRLGEEPVYVLAAIYFLFIRYRYVVMLPVIGLAVTLVAFATKTFFAMPRPLSYFRSLNMEEKLKLIEGVDVYTGATSLPSGHTMSAFAIFGFLAFCLPNRLLSLFFLALACLVGVSRIYLVQHFLSDVWLGALLGTLISVFAYAAIQTRPQDPVQSRLDRSLAWWETHQSANNSDAI